LHGVSSFKFSMMADSRRRAALLAMLLPLAAGLPGCGRREDAPSFDYTLLDGREARSSALRGQVVLVNFWATTCAVCIAEMPQLVATHRQFAPRGLQTLAVAMQYDPPSRVVGFVQARRLPFEVVIDNTGSIARSFGDVRATPTTFLIDRQGRIARRWVGTPDFAVLNDLVEKLLAEA
jgi:peroxiredoxin